VKRLGSGLAYFLGTIMPPLALAAAGARAYQLGAMRAQHRLAVLQAEVDRLTSAWREAQREKDEFLATLSHELRTPLNAMLGWIQLLRLHIKDSAEREHALEVLERNARSQVRIVGDLLDMSRIVTGKLDLALEPVHLDDVVRDVVDTLAPVAAANGVDLDVDVTPRLAVIGDRGRLHQIVSNLLSNAIKFTPPSGRVAVRLRSAGSVAEIQVADTGVGISPAVLGRVFEPFQQGDSSLTRAFGGLGLGLAIVKTLVELHGGTVEAASEGCHLGATFTVRLPLARAGAQLAH
jgi:signal transduction histidine kinase